jgi:hypothetical protein
VWAGGTGFGVLSVVLYCKVVKWEWTELAWTGKHFYFVYSLYEFLAERVIVGRECNECVSV